MITKKKGFWNILVQWLLFLPINKWQYFIHLILILDTILILVRNSYDALFSEYVRWGFIGFDLLVAFIWSFDLFNKLNVSEDKIQYARTRWYKFVGIVPIPFFRFFLFLATFKLIIITYKYIKRGESNKELFTDNEMHFSFFNFFIDSVSDAIFLNSLARVVEVTKRVDYSKVSKEIMLEHGEEVRAAVEKSLLSMKAVKSLNSLPILSNLTKELTDDVTRLILETLEMEITGKILKETNLYMLKEMDKHVRELSLDRITDKETK
jgi:hypothetical protein